jgi:hypothetical protein
MKTILTLLILILLAFAGMVVLAHHDTTVRADQAYAKLAPVTASFSRVRGDKEHLLSIYWHLHFQGAKHALPAAVGYWSLRPFRHVTFVRK